MPFLSRLDERLRTHGSRDPLGLQSVWTAFGRRLVGNLTTTTDSATNFAVALLGFHWCNEAFQNDAQDISLAQRQAYFMRYEQLAAYLRCLDNASSAGVPGANRVKKNLRDELPHVVLSAASDSQILSDQRSNGLWGVYSSAMLETGLVAGESRKPTEKGRAIAHRIEAHLNKPLFMCLTKADGEKVQKTTLETVRPPFICAIGDPDVQRELVAALLTGAAKHALQSKLRDATCGLGLDREPDIACYVHALRKQCTAAGFDDLDDCLHDIEQLERLLVAANRLFDYCCRKDGEALDTLVAAIAAKYRFDYIPDRPWLDCCGYGAKLTTIRDALRQNDVKQALQALFDLNRHVMEDRGGAPWVEVGGDGRLRVRNHSETGELPEQTDLEKDWDNSYFLKSYARIAQAVN